MSFFCIFSHPQLKLTMASVKRTKPKEFDKDGFRLMYIAPLHDDAAIAGADHIIDSLDDHFGPKTKGRGVYQVGYGPVRDALQVLLNDAPRAWHQRWPVRIGAGLAAVSLGFLMIFVGSIAWCLFLFIITVANGSALRRMAEGAVLSMFLDWRPIIYKLGRIACGRT